MTDIILEKITNIERMLIEINAKIDNFLGFEELTDEERRELKEIKEEINRGEYVEFEYVFREK